MTRYSRNLASMLHRQRVEKYLRDGVPVSGGIGLAEMGVFGDAPGQSPIIAPFMQFSGWRYTTVAGAVVGVGAPTPTVATNSGPTFSNATVGPPPEPVLAQITTGAVGVTTSELFTDGEPGVAGTAGDGFPLAIFRQLTFRARLDTPTAGRYYWGLAVPANSSTTRFSTDSLNFNFVGFRFSFSTDTTLQLYIQQGTNPPGIVPTTIVPDAVPQSHEYTIAFDGTTFRFFKDNLQIGLLNTASFFPTTTTLTPCYSVDNKSQATACLLSMAYSYKWLL